MTLTDLLVFLLELESLAQQVGLEDLAIRLVLGRVVLGVSQDIVDASSAIAQEYSVPTRRAVWVRLHEK